MKKYYFLFLVFNFLFCTNIGNAQTLQCGTTYTQPLDYNQLFGQNRFQSRPVEAKQPICVDVQFHILRNSNNVDAFPFYSIDWIVEDLNIAFNRYHIFFNKKGTDYISSDYLYNIDSDLELSVLVNTKHDSNAFNFYIVNQGNGWAGVAPDIPSNSIAVMASYALSASTTIHEVGHAFGLYHTHETDFGVENIQRSGSMKNCSFAGDQLCSTPADPKLLNTNTNPNYYKVDINCNYIGNETRLGLPYDPDTHNFMSYSRSICRNSFTQEQGDVMYALLDLPVLELSGIIGTSCNYPNIIGPTVICENEQKTYTLVNAISNSTVSWPVASNLNKIYETDTFVIIEPLANHTTETATITAMVNGYPVEKQIWIGSPNSSSSVLSSYNGSPVDTDVYMQSNDIIFAPDISIGAHYEWEIAYNNNSCLNNPNAVLPYFVDSGSNHLTNTIGQANIAWGNCPGTFSVLCYAVNSCGDRYIGMEMVEVHGFGDPEPCDDLVINVYPNPSSSEIHANIIAPPPCAPIEPTFPPGGIQATIYDMQGNPQYSKNFNSSDITIENTNLNQGNYILNIQTTTGQSGQEIIVVE